MAGERVIRLGRGAALTVGSRAASAVALVALTPFMIDRIGTAGYGVWVLILAMTGMVGLVDVGLSPAVSRVVARAVAEGRRSAPGEAVSTAAAVTLAIAVAVGAAGLALAPDLVDAFAPPAGLHDDAVTAVRIGFGVVALANVAGSYEGLLVGLAEIGAVAAIRLANTVLFASGAAVALASGAGLVGLAGSLAAAWAVTLAVLIGAGRRALGPGLVARPRRAMVRELLRYGLPRQVSRLCMVGALQYERLLVGVIAGSVAAGRYGVASVLTGGLTTLVAPALLPLIPELTEVGASAGHAALERAYERALRLFAVAGTAAFGAVAATAKPLIDAWIGHDLGHAATYAQVLAGGFLLWTLTNLGFTAAQALGRPRIELPVSGGAAAVYLAVAPVLLAAFGAGAAAVGTAAGMATAAGLYGLLIRRGPLSLAVRPLRSVRAPLTAGLALAAPLIAFNATVVGPAAPGRIGAAGIALGEGGLYVAALLGFLAARGYFDRAGR